MPRPGIGTLHMAVPVSHHPTETRSASVHDFHPKLRE